MLPAFREEGWHLGEQSASLHQVASYAPQKKNEAKRSPHAHSAATWREQSWQARAPGLEEKGSILFVAMNTQIPVKAGPNFGGAGCMVWGLGTGAESILKIEGNIW